MLKFGESDNLITLSPCFIDDRPTAFAQPERVKYKSDEIDLFRSLNSIDDIKQMAKDFGLTDKELDEVFGLVKKRKKK